MKKLLKQLQVKAGCDTIQVTSDLDAKLPKGNAIKRKGGLSETQDHPKLYHYQITCDKFRKDAGYNINDFAGILNYIKRIFKEQGANILYISRIDIRFDNLELHTYDKYYKLNAALLCLVAHKHNFENRYASIDPFTGEKKTIRVQRKAKDYAAEYYNKYIQKHKEVYARLELRSLKTEINLLQASKDFTKEIINEWFEMLMAAATPENFKEMKKRINAGYAEHYIDGQFISAAEYAACSCNSIFDARQAGGFFKSLGLGTKENAYNFFKGRPQQEKIKLDDIKAYIEILQEAATEFLKPQQQEQEQEIAPEIDTQEQEIDDDELPF